MFLQHLQDLEQEVSNEGFSDSVKKVGRVISELIKKIIKSIKDFVDKILSKSGLLLKKNKIEVQKKTYVETKEVAKPEKTLRKVPIVDMVKMIKLSELSIPIATLELASSKLRKLMHNYSKYDNKTDFSYHGDIYVREIHNSNSSIEEALSMLEDGEMVKLEERKVDETFFNKYKKSCIDLTSICEKIIEKTRKDNTIFIKYLKDLEQLNSAIVKDDRARLPRNTSVVHKNIQELLTISNKINENMNKLNAKVVTITLKTQYLLLSL